MASDTGLSKKETATNTLKIQIWSYLVVVNNYIAISSSFLFVPKK